MSMIGNFMSVDSEIFAAIINGEEDIFDLEDNAENGAQEGYSIFDVDKAWAVIQYILCKDTDEGELPMGYVIPMRLENAIDCDLDFGAFYLTAEQVKEACDYLHTLSNSTIKQMYDVHFQSMVEDEIYPIVQDEDENEFYEYIHSHLLELREFYKEAAQKNRAVIFYIT